MDSVFGFLGGKTKFFAAVWAVVQALETAEVVPAGSIQVLTDLVKVLAQAGMIWGVRDAIAKVGK